MAGWSVSTGMLAGHRQLGPMLDDLDLRVWAGVLPLVLAPHSAVPDGAYEQTPEYIAKWR